MFYSHFLRFPVAVTACKIASPFVVVDAGIVPLAGLNAPLELFLASSQPNAVQYLPAGGSSAELRGLAPAGGIVQTCRPAHGFIRAFASQAAIDASAQETLEFLADDSALPFLYWLRVLTESPYAPDYSFAKEGFNWD